MTSNFPAPVETACRALIDFALREDLGEAGDVTTLAFVPAGQSGTATFVARKPGVLAGLPAAALVFRAVDPAASFQPLVSDGAQIDRGTKIATVSGSMRSILIGERTALNFIQRLSGVATISRAFVDRVAGLNVQILDTRKTTPGWRLLEKYAVRTGEAKNHRAGLYDAVLIKDNHLAALAGHADPIATAVQTARTHAPSGMQVEVEVESLDQFDRAVASGPDIILLDNMDLDRMRECVRRRNAAGSPIRLEASGGVNLDTVRAIAETGVDRISAGALTHSAVALDIALDYGS
jgi:nicotinate-nucleotide pyrophosphorylase (carboxylating)